MKRCIIFMAGILLMLYPFVSNAVARYRQSEKNATCEEKVAGGALGSIEIPAIYVSLPIYEGTEEDVLSKGIGHIPWSSILAGGESTHSLLAGHRGLPGTELFTRLHELKKEDFFYLHMKGKTLTYKVVGVQVIRPEETHLLGVQPGRELVSLITCTPYGINTHRLIVTGERMEEDE